MQRTRLENVSGAGANGIGIAEHEETMMPADYESESSPSGSKTKQGMERAKEKASEVAREAKQRGKQRVEQGKEAASDRIQTLAGAVEDVAARLGESDQTLADFANTLAQRTTQLAENLRNRSVDDLARQATDLARRSPALFFAGSVVAGIVLARLLKVSAQHSQYAPSPPLDAPVRDPGMQQYASSGEAPDFNRFSE
jgi:hypothetical protein